MPTCVRARTHTHTHTHTLCKTELLCAVSVTRINDATFVLDHNLTRVCYTHSNVALERLFD